ncbi:MAG TPA: hypothetical protein VF886_16950, partial [Roseiarcus sp.]
RVKPCFIWLLGQGTMISDFRKENSCRIDKRLAGRGLHARQQIGQAAAAGEDIVELAKQESGLEVAIIARAGQDCSGTGAKPSY